MPRPTTKNDLINAANEQYDKLWKLINSLTEEEQNAPLEYRDILNKKEPHWARDKNMRDILIHLHEWHNLLLSWVSKNQNGEASTFLPEPYTWKTYGTMNVEYIWKKHQETPYEESKQMFADSHAEVLDLVNKFSNDELFSKNVFPWVGGSTLGSYCVSVTASHYDWAMKKIKLYIKTLKGK